MVGLESATNVQQGRDGDQQVRFQSTLVGDGQRATIVRDEQGHIVYPAPVPPETHSPTSDLSPREEASFEPLNNQTIDSVLPPSPPSAPPPPLEGPRPSQTEFFPDLEPATSPTQRRPQMGKKFVTEVPRRGDRRVSLLPPSIRRSGTNMSRLDRALSQQFQWAPDETSSSSSSSEEETDEEGLPDGSVPEGWRGRTGRPHKRSTDNKLRGFRVGNENYHTKGKISKKDGRLNITVKDTSNTGYLAKALGAAASRIIPQDQGAHEEGAKRGRYVAPARQDVACPKLNIVIMVIGSRGDAQPFLKIGKVLKEQYGHRVRIATHPAFREFVEKDSGLEFFSVGGDPSELMAFMVKNPGMIPSLETVRAGDIGRRRAAMAEMFQGFWNSCVNATDNEKDTQNLKMMGEKDPFVADAIIANPPSFAHVHCAEALGIPLHLMFTFPYTPTQAFPHPLASIKKSNVDPGYTNFISYPLVEMMVWQGLGDLVNDFRAKALGLDPVSTLWAPGATYRMHVPFTYLWSPGLVPKPEDWGAEIDVSGFVFLDLASSFKPPDPLTKFLDDGPPPVYIGFGSIVVDDADKFTEMIFEGVKLAGVRALVSKGWGGLGNDKTPDNIYMLDNVPHDYLFPRVSACVIHGGAGTTAIALKCGRPTFIVPFFGDQHFWGTMVSNADAGPKPVPYKNLTAEKLAEGIKYCLSKKAQEAVGVIAKDIKLEGDGAENACKAFHLHMDLDGKDSMRCSILEDRVAVWRLKDSNLRLSALAADIMVERGFTTWRKLRLIRHKEWNDFEGPGEPVTGAAGSVMTSVGNVFGGIGGVPVRLAKSSNKRRERRERRAKRKAAAQNAKDKPDPDGVSRKDQAEDGAPEKGGAQENGSAVAPKSDDSPASPPPPTNGETANEQREPLTRATTTETADENPVEEFVTSVGQGVGKSASALARAPVDLSLALAQGFHNAPRLYGDDTVRRPPRVTGMRSGLRAARHEFVFGVYDGVTGLVRLPVRGARAGGVRGFVKGMGMGVTGLVLKDIGALFAPVGYTFKGVIKQIERRRQPARYVRARILQGQRELRSLPGGDEERKRIGAEVERKWQVMRQLWQALADQGRESGGLGGSNKGTRKLIGEAFTSAELAERALAAVRRGEDIESVVNPGEAGEKSAGRRSLDFFLGGGRKSQDSQRRGRSAGPGGESPAMSDPKARRSSKDADGKEKRKKSARVAEPIAEEQGGEADGGETDGPDDVGLTEKRDRPMSPSEKAGELRKEKVMNGSAV